MVLETSKPDRFELAAGIKEEGYRRQWVSCQGCGLLIDVHGRKDISFIYDEDYYSRQIEKESVSEKFKRILNLPPDRSDNHFRVARVGKFAGEMETTYGSKIGWKLPKRILDIGSGTGIFLYRFLEANPEWEAVAIEPNRSACDHLRELERFRVVQDHFPSEKLKQEFHLVTLNKVLEHLKDPILFLKSVHRNLRDTGMIYIEVPDRETVRHRDPKDNILGSLHYYLFDPLTLCLVMNRSDFAPISISRYVEPSGKITVSGFGMKRSGFDKICSAGVRGDR